MAAFMQHVKCSFSRLRLFRETTIACQGRFYSELDTSTEDVLATEVENSLEDNSERQNDKSTHPKDRKKKEIKKEERIYNVFEYRNNSVFPKNIPLSPFVAAVKQSKDFKIRDHPGRMNIKAVHVPDKLESVIDTVLKDKEHVTDLKTLLKMSKKLDNFISQRQIPFSSAELTKKAEEIEKFILKVKPDMANDLEELSLKEYFTEEEEQRLDRRSQELKTLVYKSLRHRTKHSLAITYDEEVVLQYLVGRAAQNFSVLKRCLSEIKKRDPDYHPSTVYEYGSGVGMTVWAINTLWPDKYTQFHCVDPSPHMTSVASLLLRGGEPQRNMVIPGVYFRNFVPSARKNKYSMVVCAYKLFDIRDRFERINYIKDLWEMTQDYLIFVDVGTFQGHSLIMEARSTILKTAKKEREEGHVFAPCSHDNTCPKYKLRVKKEACTSHVIYLPLKIHKDHRQQLEKFSYVIFKKGPITDEQSKWPRVIMPSSKKNDHFFCYLCTPAAQIKCHTISKHKQKELYPIAKRCEWGDLIPVDWDVQKRWDFNRTGPINESEDTAELEHAESGEEMIEDDRELASFEDTERRLDDYDDDDFGAEDPENKVVTEDEDVLHEDDFKVKSAQEDGIEFSKADVQKDNVSCNTDSSADICFDKKDSRFDESISNEHDLHNTCKTKSGKTDDKNDRDKV